MLFGQQTHKIHKDVTWAQLNHPLLSKWSTVAPDKICYPRAQHLPSMSRCPTLCQTLELFFIKPRVKVSGQCCWDVLLSQQVIDAIKRVADDNFVFW